MELFSIILSVPVAFVMSMVYCAFLAKALRRMDRMDRVIHRGKWKRRDMQTVVHRMERLRRFLHDLSSILLGSFFVELVLLTTIGAVRSRAVVGPGFYVAHSVFVLLGMPALANVLVLRERGPFVGRWYFAAVICTIFAFFLVVLQYSVAEALYGFEGVPGPYS